MLRKLILFPQTNDYCFFIVTSRLNWVGFGCFIDELDGESQGDEVAPGGGGHGKPEVGRYRRPSSQSNPTCPCLTWRRGAGRL